MVRFTFAHARHAAALLIGAALLFPAPSQAADHFTAPLDGGALSSVSSPPQVQFGPDGETIAVAPVGAAGGGNSFRVAIRPPGGDVSRQLVPAAGSGQIPTDTLFSLDRAPAGNAVIAWTSGNSIFYSLRAPGGAFGAVEQLSVVSSETAGLTTVKAGVDNSGNVTFVWITDSGTPGPGHVSAVRSIQRRGDTGALVNEALLGQFGDNVSAAAPNVTVNGSGKALTSFRIHDFSLNENFIRFKYRDVALAPFGSATDLGQATLQGPVQDLDEAGNGVVGWTNLGGRPQLQKRAADGTLGQQTKIADVSALVPDFALAANGEVDVAWVEDHFDQPQKIDTCHVTDAKCDAPPTPLATITGTSSVPAVAGSPSGAALVTWLQKDAGETSARVMAAARPPGGVLGSPQQVAPAGHVAADAGLDSAGDGAIAFHAVDPDSGERLRVAGFDPNPPRIDGVDVPVGGTVGQQLPFTARAFDVWGPVQFAWTLGDGTGAGGATVSHAYATAGVQQVGLTATDAAGNSAAARGTSTIAASPSAPSPAAPAQPAANVTAPRFTSKPHSSRRSFSVPAGTKFTYALDEQATVSIRFERVVRSAGRTRLARAGALTRRSAAGRTTFRFSGKVGRKALKPGRYRATFVARDAAGNAGTPASLTFTVVKR